MKENLQVLEELSAVLCGGQKDETLCILPSQLPAIP